MSNNNNIVLPDYDVPNQNNIILEGISGEFNTEGSNFRVRFFSTYANVRETQYKKLLEQLRPMRERIEIKNIKSMSQVLQRDLDDFRISHGLIPYLLNFVNGVNKADHIPFFPSILGVVLPKDYLVDGDKKYPKLNHITDSSQSIRDYRKSSNSSVQNENELYWSLEQRITNNRISPISLLKINIDNSEVIVLDGQHRANAFRLVNKSFFSNNKNQLYEPFYNKDSVYSENTKSDLPVTLIWFEKTNDNDSYIVPDYISRKLFIDVNNNAKNISVSRKILLDDRDPSSIITNEFYSMTAEMKGFDRNSDELSLIHLGFDREFDLKSRKSDSILNITNPELLNIVVDWFFFAAKTYCNLKEYYVTKELKLKYDSAVVSKLLPYSSVEIQQSKNQEAVSIKTLIKEESKEVIENEFKNNYYKAFYNIYSKLMLFKCHYEATKRIEYERNNTWASPEKKSCWDNIFCGGQGLYNSYRKLYELQPQLKQIKDVNDVINNIEDEFADIRKKILNINDRTESNLIFDSINSVAFQVGLFMAFYFFCENKLVTYTDPEKVNDASEEFIARVNLIPVDVWKNLFRSTKENIVGGEIDPKRWPTYKNMILRLIQKEGQFFDEPTNRSFSPEAKSFKLKFRKKIKAFLETTFTNEEIKDLDIDDFNSNYQSEIDNWIQDSFQSVKDVFNNDFQIKKLMQFDTKDLAKECLRDVISA